MNKIPILRYSLKGLHDNSKINHTKDLPAFNNMPDLNTAYQMMAHYAKGLKEDWFLALDSQVKVSVLNPFFSPKFFQRVRKTGTQRTQTLNLIPDFYPVEIFHPHLNALIADGKARVVKTQAVLSSEMFYKSVPLFEEYLSLRCEHPLAFVPFNNPKHNFTYAYNEGFNYAYLYMKKGEEKYLKALDAWVNRCTVHTDLALCVAARKGAYAAFSVFNQGTSMTQTKAIDQALSVHKKQESEIERSVIEKHLKLKSLNQMVDYSFNVNYLERVKIQLHEKEGKLE